MEAGRVRYRMIMKTQARWSSSQLIHQIEASEMELIITTMTNMTLRTMRSIATTKVGYSPH